MEENTSLHTECAHKPRPAVLNQFSRTELLLGEDNMQRLFKFVRQIRSSSIRSSVPTPTRASASTVYPPTPPIPNTATLALNRRCMLSSPRSSSVLENWFNTAGRWNTGSD